MNSEIFTLQKIYQAYLDCKKRKNNTLVHLNFAKNLERNLISLKNDLNNRRYNV